MRTYPGRNGDLVARLRFLCDNGRQVEAAAVLAAAVPVDVLRAAELMQFGATWPADTGTGAAAGAGQVS